VRPARLSYLRGAGFKKERLHKTDHRRRNSVDRKSALATCLCSSGEWLKKHSREGGGTPMEFNTITISDGDHHGHAGMKAL